VTFGAVGAEESYDILLDADSPLLAPIRGLLERVGARAELSPTATSSPELGAD
jgi:hypothetical protein